MTREQWRAESVARIGAAVQRIRRAAGMSQEELAQRIGSTRNAIQNMEGGRKSTFDVLDLMEIANALEVPPILLLFPNLPDGQLTALPETDTVASHRAFRWFTGEANLFGSSADRCLRLLEYVRKYVLLRQEFAPVLVRFRARQEDSALRAALLDLESRLGDISVSIAKLGGHVDLSPEITALAETYLEMSDEGKADGG